MNESPPYPREAAGGELLLRLCSPPAATEVSDPRIQQPVTVVIYPLSYPWRGGLQPLWHLWVMGLPLASDKLPKKGSGEWLAARCARQVKGHSSSSSRSFVSVVVSMC